MIAERALITVCQKLASPNGIRSERPAETWGLSVKASRLGDTTLLSLWQISMRHLRE